MIWATVSSWSCFCWLCGVSPSSAAKNIINLISVLTIWWCPRVVLSHVVGRGCLQWPSVSSWQNSVSLCLASYCTPRSNLPVSSGISWLPTFAFQSPIMKRTFFLGVLECLVGLHRTVQLQLFQHYFGGHRLGLLWYWKVCLGNEQSSFCGFWDCTQVLHFRLFCWLWELLNFF